MPKVRILCVPRTNAIVKDFARSLSSEMAARVLVETATAEQIEAALSTGKASMAISDRMALASTPGAKALRNMPFAVKGVLFAVNKENPATRLSSAQIEKIMDGAISDWSQLGGPRKEFRLYLTAAIQAPKPAQEPEPTHAHKPGCSGEECKKDAGKDKQLQPRKGRQVEAANSEAAISLLLNDPGGLAALDLSALASDEVKLLAVDDALPSLESAVSGKYPFSKTLYLVLPEGADEVSSKALAQMECGGFDKRLLADSCIPLGGKEGGLRK